MACDLLKLTCTNIVQNFLLFRPSKRWLTHPKLPEYTETYFGRDKHLHGLFFRAKRPSKRVIIFFHGNSNNVSYNHDMINFLLRLNVNVFAMDYSGYGKSKGKPSERQLYSDGVQTYDFMKKSGFRDEDIILYGQSLGGAVAIHTAKFRRAASVVSHSTFTSIGALVPPICCGFDIKEFSNEDNIGDVRSPILIVHSKTDSFIPLSHAMQLYSLTVSPTEFYEIRGDHNDSVLDKDYLFHLEDFIMRY